MVHITRQGRVPAYSRLCIGDPDTSVNGVVLGMAQDLGAHLDLGGMPRLVTISITLEFPISLTIPVFAETYRVCG